ESTADIPVIFITAKNKTESLVEGFRIGGVDYITKPFEKEEVLIRVDTHLKINRLTKVFLQTSIELAGANRALQQEIGRRKQAEDARQTADERLSLISQREAERWGIAGFVGKSQTIAKILKDISRLQTTGTVSVLITGESGTGKELIARAIHFGGPRAKRPFIPVNCSAVPRDLAESEFFGHIRGAFTGANTDRKGHFELADGGTLFLDEIGDMPLELQAKLLRVLEDGIVTPVGGTRSKQVDVRILAATNTDLEAKIAEGLFRSDLYFRLAEFPVPIPPLRERPEDIPLLAEHFLHLFSTEMELEKPML
ncbi:MAG: sigma-54 dependent transcriptional regulator, partial [Candidatus Poribacteria bacterium]|nr:sigma-54 dependent transcriptional regulator [Candidatus Poribacteria bacterium]